MLPTLLTVTVLLSVGVCLVDDDRGQVYVTEVEVRPLTFAESMQALVDAVTFAADRPDGMSDAQWEVFCERARATWLPTEGRCLTPAELAALYSKDTGAIFKAAGEVARRAEAFRGDGRGAGQAEDGGPALGDAGVERGADPGDAAPPGGGVLPARPADAGDRP